MGKNRKTVPKGFRYRNCDDFAAYLNHMARLGWHFKEWRAGLVFEKGKPEDAVYALEVFTKADETDLRPLPETEEFAAYCEAAGWKFVDAWQKFVVFKRIREDAVPILTDRERLENVIKAEKPFIWYPLAHCTLWFGMKLSEFSFLFPQRIFSPQALSMVAFWGMLLLLTALQAVQFLLWKRRCHRRLDRGLSLFFGKSQSDKWYHWGYLLIGAGYCVSIVLSGSPLLGYIYLSYVLALMLLSFLLGKLRPDSNTAGLIQLLGSIAIVVGICFAAFYGDQAQKQAHKEIPEPPLTYGDMGITMELEKTKSFRQEQSIFGTWQYFSLDYGDDYLYYHLYTTDVPWVLDGLWKEETDGRVNETRDDCTDAWDAEEAFRNYAGNYLVRYGDAIWVICPSMEESLTQEQIDLAIAAIRGD